jgi:hypothetical protein
MAKFINPLVPKQTFVSQNSGLNILCHRPPAVNFAFKRDYIPLEPPPKRIRASSHEYSVNIAEDTTGMAAFFPILFPTFGSEQ